ncbi:MAG: ABC-type nitrate/sulfonate/bicarbonate transport system permease component [Myxococcota bacterium]|jgi:ABC-type nitrate/sulfonate/bicarbonate transport system permease component
MRLRQEPPLSWRVLLGVACIGMLLLIWYILTAGGASENRIMNAQTLPSIGEVFGSLPGLVSERNLFESIAASLTRVFIGFGLAVLVGVPMGMLAGAWRPFNAYWAPLVMFGRSVPIAALIPLTMMWFGLGEFQKFMFIYIACVPFIFSGAAASVASIHERYVETGQTLGASSGQIFRKVLVPLAMPTIYTQLRQLFGLAFGYIMLAELVNAQRGLGSLIQTSQKRSRPEDILMILIIIVVIAFLIDRILAFFQKGLFPYKQGGK